MFTFELSWKFPQTLSSCALTYNQAILNRKFIRMFYYCSVAYKVYLEIIQIHAYDVLSLPHAFPIPNKFFEALRDILLSQEATCLRIIGVISIFIRSFIVYFVEKDKKFGDREMVVGRFESDLDS